MEKEKMLAQMIQESKRIVAFTGAGISTESGIPDFRSAGGIYDQLEGRQYSGEEALHAEFLERYLELFFQNYREALNFPEAQPNSGHRFFKKLEDAGKQVEIVTQNIDHLHEEAGSKKVWHLHGDTTRWKVHETGEPIPADEIIWGEKGVPHDSKGRLVRPDIVLYGEPLDPFVFQAAEEAIAAADLLIVIGTGLNVYPAAGLPESFSGRHAVLINQTPVASFRHFDLVFQARSGEVLEKTEQYLKN